jgi:hypothetical protein
MEDSMCMDAADLAQRKKLKRPKWICINKYYMLLIVVTQQEIRGYRLKDGFMQFLHANLFDDNSSIITNFR